MTFVHNTGKVMTSATSLPGWRGLALFALRALIGWHFLYEGLAKLWTPGWSAVGYLSVSRWWLADFFHWIASDPTRMQWVDSTVIWALIGVGVCLILGCFTRVACQNMEDTSSP